MNWFARLWQWLRRWFTDEPTEEERERLSAAETLASVCDIGVPAALDVLPLRDWMPTYEAIVFDDDPKARYEERCGKGSGQQCGAELENARVAKRVLDELKERVSEYESTTAKAKECQVAYRISGSTTGAWHSLPYIERAPNYSVPDAWSEEIREAQRRYGFDVTRLPRMSSMASVASASALSELFGAHRRGDVSRKSAVNLATHVYGFTWDEANAMFPMTPEEKEAECERREEIEQMSKTRLADLAQKRVDGWDVNTAMTADGDEIIVNATPPVAIDS